MAKIKTLLSIFIFLWLNLFSGAPIDWSCIDSDIKACYIINSSKQSTELIRLYGNDVFEHLKYSEKSNKTYVERYVSKYTLDGARITFEKPSKQVFSSKFIFKTYYFKEKKLYSSSFNMYLRPKHEAYPRTKNKNYFKPFFMCLETNEIVYNSEAAEKIDLKCLVNYLTSEKKTEKEKANSLIEFIANAIEYDMIGYRESKYAHDQDDISGILCGTNRVAVCAGYANIFALLCEYAGLKGGRITGYSKQHVSDLMQLGGNHAWNWVEIEGKKQLVDVTWADGDQKLKLDREWIFTDPQIMLGTHFPDSSKYQFLDKSVTREDYLNAPIVIPEAEGISFLKTNVSAFNYVKESFTLAIPGKHEVKCYLLPDHLIYTMYSDEKSGDRSYNPLSIGDLSYKNDSTYINFDLKENLNPIEIRIKDHSSIQFILIKNGIDGLMTHYIQKCTNQHAIPFIKGIAAAIKLKDAVTLKKFIGNKHEQFFDSKGKLKLNQDLVNAFISWEGETSELSITYLKKSAFFNGENVSSTEEKVYSVEIGSKVRFIIDFDGNQYTFKSYELIVPRKKSFY